MQACQAGTAGETRAYRWSSACSRVQNSAETGRDECTFNDKCKLQCNRNNNNRALPKLGERDECTFNHNEDNSPNTTTTIINPNATTTPGSAAEKGSEDGCNEKESGSDPNEDSKHWGDV